MKVLITGGAGFIGTSIVEEALNMGWEPIVVDNLYKGKYSVIHKNVPFYNIDIRSNELEHIFQKHRPEVVIHQAAQVSVQYSNIYPLEDCDINTIGTLNLLNFCVKYQVRKIVFASSAAVYGNNMNLPITEDAMLNPLSFYGFSKYSAEQYIKMFQQHHNLTYTILRYSNVYGVGQRESSESGVITQFFTKMLQNGALTIYGDGEQTRDFIYVKDVAEANIKAAMLGDNEIINISTNTKISINKLMREMVIALDSHSEINYEQSRMGDIMKSCLSNQKAKKLLEWEPEFTIKQGIEATKEYFIREIYKLQVKN